MNEFRCETCKIPACESGSTKFKSCSVVGHFVLMEWEGKYVPYTQTAQDLLKIGCASHSDFRKRGYDANLIPGAL